MTNVIQQSTQGKCEFRQTHEIRTEHKKVTVIE